MNTITVSATKARNEFFSILNQVALGRSFTVKKDNYVVAQITPVSDKESWEERKKDLLKVAEETRGILRGMKFKSPLRGKKANAWLGRWDKNIKRW